MAIFRRRAVQRALNSVVDRAIISPEQRRAFVRRLNSRTQDALSAEWEVILLQALSGAADVTYEKSFGGVPLDIFAVSRTSDNRIEFVGDIVAISDVESDKRNPSEFFFSEFHRLADKHGCGDGGFDIRIGDEVIGDYPDKRTRLLLPPKGEISTFAERELQPFFQKIRSDPQSPHSWGQQHNKIDIQIAYDPKQRGGVTGGYAYAASPLSLRRNPLFRALNDKARRLHRSRYSGLCGIFVTDNGCRALAATGGGLGEWSRDRIVQQFVEEHPQIHFVSTTTYENRGGWGRREHTLCNRFYTQRTMDAAVVDTVYSLIRKVFEAVPSVFEAPYNARNNIRNRRQIPQTCRLGEYTWMPRHNLTLSSRTFVGLVGATLSEQDFRLLFFRSTPPHGGPLVNFFRHVAELRLPISRATVTHRPDHDDDLVSFEIGAVPFDDVVQDSHVDTDSCCISTNVLTRYFAGLDYRPLAKPHQSYLGKIPDPIRDFVQEMQSNGRMLTGTEVINQGKQIRLIFGERDAAVSDFF